MKNSQSITFQVAIGLVFVFQSLMWIELQHLKSNVSSIRANNIQPYPTIHELTEQELLEKSSIPTPTPIVIHPIFGNLTRGEVLQKAIEEGASAKDLEEVARIYDLVTDDQLKANPK